MIDPAQDQFNNPPDSLRIVIPFIPPSSNKIYVTDWKRKMRFLGKEAVAFKDRFKAEVVPKYLPWISQLIDAEKDPSVTYKIHAQLFFDQWDLLNKGWFATPRKAITRYKKMDTGNRFKLLFDCVAEAIGIDDSHYFGSGGEKLSAKAYNMDPQVHIFLWRVDPNIYGV